MDASLEDRSRRLLAGRLGSVRESSPPADNAGGSRPRRVSVRNVLLVFAWMGLCLWGAWFSFGRALMPDELFIGLLVLCIAGATLGIFMLDVVWPPPATASDAPSPSPTTPGEMLFGLAWAGLFSWGGWFCFQLALMPDAEFRPAALFVLVFCTFAATLGLGFVQRCFADINVGREP